MKKYRKVLAVLMAAAMTVGMTGTILAEESEAQTIAVEEGVQQEDAAGESRNQGIQADILEGAGSGILKETDTEIPTGSSLKMDGMNRGAIGNDQFSYWGDQEDGDYTTIADWNIRVPSPDNSISVLDESAGEFYIYAMGQEGIPYVMIMLYNYSDGGEAFLHAFRENMLGYYPDLTVTEEIHETTIGGYPCWQTRYEYSISGYTAHDRRVALEHDGRIYMFAVKEIPELELTVGNLLEDTMAGMLFIEDTGTDSENGNSDQGGVLDLGGTQQPTGQTVPSGTSSGTVSSDTAFTVTKIKDTDSGLTLARMYAPSDYSVIQNLNSYGDNASTCSPACPMQLVLVADSPDYSQEMMYCSSMSYVYSEPMYREGELFYGISSMLEPMTASAYADWMVQRIYQNVGDITILGEREASDAEQTYLQERAQQYYDYYSSGFASNGYVNLDGTMCTYIEKTYGFQQNGISYTVTVITATDLVQYTVDMGGLKDTQVEMIVPYVYVYGATSDQADAGRANFDLFLSNTRVSDEFNLVNQKMSIALEAAITSGTDPKIDDSEIADTLGTGDGSYDTEQFCDYILSQNSYTTSDGKVVKIPNSYDYVYEGDDGNIYASNSTDQPAGSTRLYADQ